MNASKKASRNAGPFPSGPIRRVPYDQRPSCARFDKHCSKYPSVKNLTLEQGAP